MYKKPPRPVPMKYRDKTRCNFVHKNGQKRLCTNDEVRGIIIVDAPFEVTDSTKCCCKDCIQFKFGMKARVRYSKQGFDNLRNK